MKPLNWELFSWLLQYLDYIWTKTGASSGLIIFMEVHTVNDQIREFFRDNRDDIILAFTFNQSWLASKLQAKGLIEDETRQYVAHPNNGEMEKSRKMVDNLEKKIKLRPSNLHQLLEILREKNRDYMEVISILTQPIVIWEEDDSGHRSHDESDFDLQQKLRRAQEDYNKSQTNLRNADELLRRSQEKLDMIKITSENQKMESEQKLINCQDQQRTISEKLTECQNKLRTTSEKLTAKEELLQNANRNLEGLRTELERTKEELNAANSQQPVAPAVTFSRSMGDNRILITSGAITFAAAVICYIIALPLSWNMRRIVDSRNLKAAEYALGGAVLNTLPLLNTVVFIGFAAPVIYSIKKNDQLILIPVTHTYAISTIITSSLMLVGGATLIIAGDLARKEVEGIVNYGVAAGVLSFLTAVLSTVSVLIYLEYNKKWRKLLYNQQFHRHYFGDVTH